MPSPSPAQPAPTPHPSLSPSYTIGSSGSTASSLTGVSLNASNGRYFQDQHHRSLLIRGCSISGLNKLPTEPNGFTHLADGFFDHETVSFIGRPFPLEEAHDHFSRLQQWGLTFIRLVIPWESLEHAGPGVYDTDYIDFLHALISLMPRYGLKCFIDAHQDVWSRHTGGSGAPHWTLATVGLDIRNLKATGAAHAHNLHLHPDDPPPKVWPSGYCKLAAATCATVFWGGETFAPKRRIARSEHLGAWGAGGREEVNVQEFLQMSMIEAFGALADRIKDLEAVVGFEVINEPHRGYIELLSPFSWDFKTDLAIGYFPSAVQSWALGAGHAVLIDHYGPSFPVTAKTHAVLLSPPQGRTAWIGDRGCIWEEHGVWAWDPKRGEVGEPVALRCEYFTKDETGREVDWYMDFYWPFCQKFGKRIGKINSAWHSFVGPIPNEFCPMWPETLRPHNLVYAPHWYDLQSLFSKSIGTMSANVQGLSRGMLIFKALHFGRKGLKKNYALQIRNIVNAGYRSIGERPVVIGETGIPFDLHKGEAFRSGDFSWQERQIDAVCSAMESNLVSFNLWNYNPLNNDEWGDSWNQENFSWFSTSDITPEKLAAAAKKSEAARLNVGARVLDAVERPYACKIAGIPIHTHFDMRTLAYSLRFVNPSSRSKLPQAEAETRYPPVKGAVVQARETEIYLPRRRYEVAAREGRLEVRVGTKDGTWAYDVEKQTLYFLHKHTEPGFVHSVEVRVTPVEDGSGMKRLLVLLGLVALLLALWMGAMRA